MKLVSSTTGRIMRGSTTGSIMRNNIADVAVDLAEHIANRMSELIDGVTANDTTKAIFSGNAFNSSCWAAPLDLTCISTSHPSATLITPRHAIGAEHFNPPSSLTFIASDGAVVTRTVSGRVNIGPSNASDGYATDFNIVTLDSDVPATVTPCKVVPSNILDYLPTLSNVDPVPCLVSDQEEKALITSVYSMISTRSSFMTPPEADFAAFHESKIGGDSGAPAFFVINDELVLITTWAFGGAGSGPSAYYLNTEINGGIASADAAAGVSTGYTINNPALGSFNN